MLVKTKGVEARVTFTWEPDDTLPLIEANSELLRQVLLNIMINAVQSIPARGNLFISTCYMEEQRVMVVIRDDGTGIPRRCKRKSLTRSLPPKPREPGWDWLSASGSLPVTAVIFSLKVRNIMERRSP